MVCKITYLKPQQYLPGADELKQCGRLFIFYFSAELIEFYPSPLNYSTIKLNRANHEVNTISEMCC